MTTTYDSLKGKRILVTGGAGGIGAEVVKQFCIQEALVYFLDFNESASVKLADELERDLGVRPEFKICDLRDIERVMQEVLVEWKDITFDVLINNAGNDKFHLFHEVTSSDWDDQVKLNLKHQYFLSQFVSKNMRTKNSGSIINLGSISWMLGVANVSVYTTLKSAISGLTKSLARELGTSKIRVNAVAPGWVLTEKQSKKAQDMPEKVDSYLEKQCIKELLQPVDVAFLCLWLACDDSRYVTGQTIICDGGVI